MSEPEIDPVPGPAAPLPANIAQLAASSGLGPLHRVQRGSNPFKTSARSLAYAFGWLVGLCALGLLFQKLDVGPLGLLAVPFLAGAIIATIKAVRNLLVGFTTTYLFTNGLIHVKNQRVHVIPWADVDRLMVSYFAGEQVCYHLATFSGRKIRIELESADGDPNLGLDVAHKVEELGRPIVATGPSSRRAHR